MRSIGAELAAALPDPGSPDFPAFAGALGAFVFAAQSIGAGQPREETEWRAFVGGLVGLGVGLALYLFALIADLY